MNWRKPWRALLIAFCIAAAAAGFAPLSTTPTIVVGIVGNFKGKNSQGTYESINTLKLAYELFQKKHPDCFKLQILPVDDSHESDKTKGAYLEVVDHADLLLLHVNSTSLSKIRDDIAAHPDKLHALFGASTAEITGKADNIVRNYADTHQEQRQMATFIDKLGCQRLLVLTDADNFKYSGPAVNFFKEYSHCPQIDTVSFSPNQMDIGPAMAMIESNNYSLLYILAGALPREAGIIIQNARKIRPDLTVINTPWVRGKIFAQALGETSDNVYLSSHVQLQDNQANADFQAEYKSHFGCETEEFFSCLCFDMATAMFSAIQEAESPKADKALPLLLSKEYDGITGRMKFNQYGDTSGQLYFYLLSNGQWQMMRDNQPLAIITGK